MAKLLMLEMRRNPLIRLDPEDYEKYKHTAVRYLGGYLVTGGPEIVMLHRLIMGSPESRVDHKDRNKLNCRKANLRLATNSQNCRNAPAKCNNTSGYKGVYPAKSKNRWLAQIRGDGRQIFLGSYRTPELAATAYNEAALKYHGEFAFLNELPEVSQIA